MNPGDVLPLGASTAVKDAGVKVKTHAVNALAKTRTLTLGDWGSLASIAGLALWVIGATVSKRRAAKTAVDSKRPTPPIYR